MKKTGKVKIANMGVEKIEDMTIMEKIIGENITFI
jgi:hypothetical protein